MRRHLVGLAVLTVLAGAGCASIGRAPASPVGDSGWARVMDLERGEEIRVYLEPPVEAYEGIELRAVIPRPNLVGPPYQVPMRATGEVVSVSRDRLLLDAAPPVAIERAAIDRIARRRRPSRGYGFVRGLVSGAALGWLIGGLTTDEGDSYVNSAAKGAAITGSVFGVVGIAYPDDPRIGYELLYEKYPEGIALRHQR